MKKFLGLILIASAIISCSSDKDKMVVTGNIQGLKKGVLYLQKFQDTTFVTVDSLKIDGDSHFTFTTSIKEPEAYYLYLNKYDGNAVNDRILFFGEKGTININTTRDYFEGEAKIEGSKGSEVYAEYNKMISKFSAQNLNYIKEEFEAKKEGDTARVDSIEKAQNRNMTRRYLYTLNYALNNKDSYVAPYIALADAYNAKVKFLDTIYKSLTPEVSTSKYGKALGDYIDEIKKEEKQQDSIK
ncbi:DUF4369 domain-containing protein [Zhouia sp. PK063]|uniref:DUF4369 domain-containing protein n=1 Tax=Zhouia sp. PK063 TaxID=3373602 RepID=UPI0037959951